MRNVVTDDPFGVALFNAGVTPTIAEREMVVAKPGTKKERDADVEGDPLAKYCVELVQLARENKLGDATDRCLEIEDMILTFRAKSNNNPLLIGGHFVGMTRVVGALAK